MSLKEEIKELMVQEGTLETVMSFFKVKESIYEIHWVDRIYYDCFHNYYFAKENNGLLTFIGSYKDCAVYKRNGYTAVVLKETYKENILYVSNTGVNNG